MGTGDSCHTVSDPRDPILAVEEFRGLGRAPGLGTTLLLLLDRGPRWCWGFGNGSIWGSRLRLNVHGAMVGRGWADCAGEQGDGYDFGGKK